MVWRALSRAMSVLAARKEPAAARGGLPFPAEREQDPDRQSDGHEQPPIVPDFPQDGLEPAEQPRQQNHGPDRDHTEGEQADKESDPTVHRPQAKAGRLVAASEIPPAPAAPATPGRSRARLCRHANALSDAPTCPPRGGRPWCCHGGDERHDGDRVEFAKHLLVDGYNIAHAWPDLRRVLAKEGREVARERLVERVRILHDFERLRVSVVFDGRGGAIAIERPTQHTTFSVLYTPGGMTADDLIEQLTVQAAQPRDVCVATADSAERDTVEAAGAQAISPEQLAAWVERAEQAQRAAVAAHQRRTDSRWREDRRQ